MQWSSYIEKVEVLTWESGPRHGCSSLHGHQHCTRSQPVSLDNKKKSTYAGIGKIKMNHYYQKYMIFYLEKPREPKLNRVKESGWKVSIICYHLMDTWGLESVRKMWCYYLTYSSQQTHHPHFTSEETRSEGSSLA